MTAWMTLPLVVPPVLLGSQQPSLLWVPEYESSTGEEAVEVAALAGLNLDPWQQLVLIHGLGERDDGRWAAFEVGVEVARQNGKGGILEARELAGLFVLGERLIIHSAHEFATSLEAFRRLLALIEDTPDFDRRVQRVSRAHGDEGLELKGGQRIRFRTRTKGGGRGFSCDCLMLDEAMVIPKPMHGALLPTLSARPNPQVWYTGSAVDQESMEHGEVFARLRHRAIRGGDPRLAYFGFGAADCKPDELTPEQLVDRELWARGNPGLGIRITEDHIANEQRSMDPRTFAVERLGVGDWPDVTVGRDQAISLEKWAGLTDTASRLVDPVCLAFDVRPDRSKSAISAAGSRPDGLGHVETVEHRVGTDWVVPRLVELNEAHRPAAIVCASASPAMSLVAACEKAGLKIQVATPAEQAQSCGELYDAVDQESIRHLGTPELAVALKGAVKRPIGDAWAWSRKSSTVDISPLVAGTLAYWAAKSHKPRPRPRFEVLA